MAGRMNGTMMRILSHIEETPSTRMQIFKVCAPEIPDWNWSSFKRIIGVMTMTRLIVADDQDLFSLTERGHEWLKDARITSHM
jgi:hypothetical protein